MPRTQSKEDMIVLSNQEYTDLTARIQDLEAENAFLLKCLEETRFPAESSAELTLRRQLIAAYQVHLDDIEQDMRMIGEYLAVTSRDHTGLIVSSLQSASAEASRWKSEYYALANSKLGRIQCWYWRFREKITRRRYGR